jgi:hypothetical protein
MATIRRTSQPHQYLLAVTRVFEEGEEALQDDDQDDRKADSRWSPLELGLTKIMDTHHTPFLFSIVDDEKTFLIDQSIRFKKGVSAGATAFSWQGLSAVSGVFDPSV